MKVIAVTGGIASGKSTVTRMLADLGAQTASADADARVVLTPPSPTLDTVLAAFPNTRNADGTLNRAALARTIFADDAARRQLNALMHPAIRAHIRAAIDAARDSDEPGLFAYEVPLLYEGGLETWFDAVVVAFAPEKHQAARLQERERKAGRPNLSVDALAERLSAQMPSQEKARRADYVIRTDVSLEETRAEVARVYQSLTQG